MAANLILNLPEFCARAATLEGEFAPQAFSRLHAELVGIETGRWRVAGRLAARHELPEFAGLPVLELTIEAVFQVACVRCLEPVRVELSVDQAFVALASEAAADDALAEDERFDAIVSSTHFDLAALIEDEALMALPSQPHHERCSAQALAALGLKPGEEGVMLQAPKDNPFAVLEALKKH